MALEVLVRAREQQLQQVRLETVRLARRFRAGRGSPSPEEIVEVVTTRDATLQRWEQLQRSARREVRSFDRPPYATNVLINDAERDGLAAGISFRAVYAREGLELPGRLEATQRLVAAGEQARVAAGLPVKMFLADDTMGLVPLERPGRADSADSADSALVIHSSSLLDTLSALFEAIWASAVPIRFGDNEPEAAYDDGRQRRVLLGMLAAGLTDEAIGRQLGWHPRTVQRHVRRLMTDLGAQTRFQAGLQAAKRGWL
jgi:DNA-binding CsgD family transcriptional regulator